VIENRVAQEGRHRKKRKGEKLTLRVNSSRGEEAARGSESTEAHECVALLIPPSISVTGANRLLKNAELKPETKAPDRPVMTYITNDVI
jgi:hypothetical protein